MNEDTSLYVSAGFLVAKRADRRDSMSPDLLPDRIISASNCICNFIPDVWAIEWAHKSAEEREKSALSFGLAPSELKRLMAWVTPRFDKNFGWPHVCFDLGSAGELIRLFLDSTEDIAILELGLHRKFVDIFCKEAEPQPPPKGYAPMGRQGIYEAVLKGLNISSTGTCLGFEPLVFNLSLSCSWLCNGLERDVHEYLGIDPNAHGLIGTFDEACACVQYISREEVGAEPGLWLPWLLIEHTFRNPGGSPAAT